MKAVIIRAKKSLGEVLYLKFLGDIVPAWIHKSELLGIPSDTKDYKTFMWKKSAHPTIHQFSRDPSVLLDKDTYI